MIYKNIRTCKFNINKIFVNTLKEYMKSKNVLTIDVGLRHLAMCVMSCENISDFLTYKIQLWDVFNTLDGDDYKCDSTFKNGKQCGRKCSMKYKDTSSEHGVIIHCCKTHFPKDIIPNKTNTFKIKSIDDYLLQDIAKIFLKKIDVIYTENKDIFDKIDTIQIELQPKENRKMIFVSHILYGKLVEIYSTTNVSIRFVRASTKLKAYTGPKIECHLKGPYAQRKWLSVQYTKWILSNQFCESQSKEWCPILESHKKLNDMTDTFCFAVNAIRGFVKTTNKKNKCIK